MGSEPSWHPAEVLRGGACKRWTGRGQDLELALVHNDINSHCARIPGCTSTSTDTCIRPCLTQRAARTLRQACQAGQQTRASDNALSRRDTTRRDSAMAGGRWRALGRPPQARHAGVRRARVARFEANDARAGSGQSGSEGKCFKISQRIAI